MSDIITKVNISIGDSVWEFSGSEAFVQKQIDEFKELICGNLNPVKAKKQKGKQTGEKTGKVDDSTQNNAVSPYPNIFEYDGETINILKVPGNNKADKTKNLTFIYLWAKEKFNRSPTPTKEISNQCETHGCLDTHNFSSILGRIDNAHVIIKGKAKSQTIKLTAPGRSKAKQLIESLNTGD